MLMPMVALKTLILVLSGTLCGFFSSSPPGPINLLVADSVLGERKLHRSSFIIGVIIGELTIAGIAFWGYHEFFDGPAFQRWAPLVGGVFVIGLGGAGLFLPSGRKEGRSSEKEHSGKKKGGDFFQGLFLCISNPAFLLFWIYVMSFISYLEVSDGVPMKSLFLLMGIGLGNTIWFTFFTRLLYHGADRLKGALLPYLRKGISVALIFLGLAGIIMFF